MVFLFLQDGPLVGTGCRKNGTRTAIITLALAFVYLTNFSLGRENI